MTQITTQKTDKPKIYFGITEFTNDKRCDGRIQHENQEDD